MKFVERQAVVGAAILLLAVPAHASLSHLETLDKRHAHLHHRKAHSSPRAEGLGEALGEVEKRQGQCLFPTSAGLVAVTPGSLNAGWAQAPDMPCKPGHYCPYACPPGQLMAQWDPAATSYTYPESQYGGLYCDDTGAISKPFPNKPYCYEGEGTVSVQNNCGSVHAVCQTVLPGYEDMLIPTEVDGSATLAVPGMDYWANTAAHYYHNTPGVTTEEGCVWGDGSQAIGNWAPYVSGANMDANGNTFVKIAWNPIYLNSGFGSTLPTWGLKIICSGGGCNGLPCSIDPSVNKINEVTSADSASGAGGGDFCVVTVPQGGSAEIVVFDAGDSNSSGGGSKPSASPTPSPSPTPTPTPTSTPTPTPTPTSTSSSSSAASSSTSTSSSSSSIVSSSSSSPTTSSETSSTSSAFPSISNAPHVLFQNNTDTTNGTSSAVVVLPGTTVPLSPNGAATAPPAATTSSSASTTLLSTGSMGVGAFFAVAAAYLL